MSDTPTHHEDPRGIAEWLAYLAKHGSSMPPEKRRRVYLLTTIAALLAIWLPVGLFLLLSPVTFTSKWSLIMPVTGAGQTLNLESIGQATASVTSPFAQHSVDPKVNYKAIATSKPVLKDAAARVEMHESEFGKPRIKLVDLTSLINFESTGRTAQEAQDKAYALYQALQERLDLLRQDEFSRREHYTNASLNSYSEKLIEAQQRIVSFQLSARIISLEQFNDITLGIESDRREAADLRARLAGARGRIAEFQRALGINGDLTDGVLALHQDASFQELLRRQAESGTMLAEREARFGARHFEVLDAREVHAALTAKLRQRARALGVMLDQDTALLEALARHDPGGASFQNLASIVAEARGMEAELAQLDRQIALDEQRLAEGIVDATTLEDLERKQQVALAVFTSALAKVDLGRADNFASYPMLQMLSEPTLPYRRDMLGSMLALAGGVFGTVFCLFGLAVLWVRKPFLQKILKSE